MKNEVINLGNDNEISIKQLAIAVMNTIDRLIYLQKKEVIQRKP